MSHLYLLHVGSFFAGISGSIFILLFCFYFLPTIIAMLRGKSNSGAILVMNLFLGWTFIGWVVALIWAAASEQKPQQVIIHNSAPAPTQPQFQHTMPTVASVSGDQSHTSNGSRLVSEQDKINQLRQLKQLLDEGTLTEAEFAAQKAKILAL